MVICLALLNVTLKSQISLRIFSEMTPIFKNTEVSLKDIGEFMQEYAKQYNIKDVPAVS